MTPADEPADQYSAASSRRQEVDQIVPTEGGTPVYTDQRPEVPPVDPGADGGATQTLSWLQRRTPFFDLFVTVAVRSRTEKSELERVSAMREQHPRSFKTCCFLDLATRLLITALLLAVVAGVAWKTLMPLPDWMER